MKYELQLDWNAFLKEYWGKKPVVIKKGFVDFVDPISPEELAGLAMEEEVESRLVSCANGQWSAEFGPFESFGHLGEDHWSLLIQAVNHWHQEAAQLVEPFKALPQWQFDDLMISYATPSSGVGPHIDNYDVFIIQGQGKRNWKVGDRNPKYKQFSAHSALLHVEAYEPIIDVILEVGDILYLPTGFPHHGVSLTHSLSYSIGFRAPTSQELLSGFADYVIDAIPNGLFYQDPDLTLSDKPYAIDDREIHKMQQQIEALIENPAYFYDFLGRKMTEPKHELDLLEVDPAYDWPEFWVQLQTQPLYRTLGIKVLKVGQKGYVNGEVIDLPESKIEFLCQTQRLSHSDFTESQWRVLWPFVNQGFWYFDL